ncbi:tol-pal system protein YbgF [Ideonella sp.]|uniref:tol-pal system protein YbgF n=1 Tax=Ideonella sp. TaxID=1929293 RepID=UPI002B481DD7|nr:tol-pal system protein YbgF [Ideonella sp.]HJV68594.1 tol-pal system protein YbgF [Ideonella sp.]
MARARPFLLRAVALGALLAATLPARAGLFDDDEARKAILDLRAKVAQGEQQRSEQAAALKQLSDQLQTLQRSMLDLNNQNEQLRAELARLRGQDEQMLRDLSEVQRKQKDIAQGVDERMRKLEPQQVSVDGKEFSVDSEEKRIYDEAMAAMRSGEYDRAAPALSSFLRRYPASGYVDSVRYWLGNAQYGQRQYKDAIATFRAFVTAAPDHLRAPEALLALANCQAELKDNKSAKRTLEELIKQYPKSEAAQAARERLVALK